MFGTFEVAMFSSTSLVIDWKLLRESYCTFQLFSLL